MLHKLRVAVFFGGKSAEHEVSLQSAKNVVDALDKNKYEILLVGLDRQGRWLLDRSPQALQSSAPLCIDASRSQPVALEQGELKSLDDAQSHIAFDVAFPVLHGPNGEDGTIQGLLQLANVPFVGAGILSSALCMDKDFMKRILRDANLPVVPYVTLQKYQQKDLDYKAVIAKVGLPCFVKPANMGSSVGVSKVTSLEALPAAIEHAFCYDTKVLVETFVKAREIECSVLGNDYPKVSLPGEIVPIHDFYSYEAKYLDDDGARLIIPAVLTQEQVAAAQALSLKAFQALGCEGMARVDLFLTANNEFFINELNTIPGFTRISMYPKLWETSGLSYSALLDELIQLALARFDRRQALQITPEVD